MFDALANSGLFIVSLNLSAQSGQSVLGNLAGELRLRPASANSTGIDLEVFAARISKSLDWDPDQPLYFEATGGGLSFSAIDTQRGSLTGRLVGWYRRPVVEVPSSDEGRDFLESPAFAAELAVSLTLTLPDAGALLPKVSGNVVIESSAFVEGLNDNRQINAIVVEGEGRLYPHDLPANDLAEGKPNFYFLKILPILVRGASTAGSEAADFLLAGASETWHSECRIRILPGRPIIFRPGDSVIAKLNSGNTIPLRKAIRKNIQHGLGVPVAFVQPRFSASGGEASGHGPQTAIVVVSEESFLHNNKTILAHEFGHVLGGKEAGNVQTANYWVGERDTVMEGSGAIVTAPPPRAGTHACENARRFALSGVP
jgi:hypothetical protein